MAHSRNAVAEPGLIALAFLSLLSSRYYRYDGRSRRVLEKFKEKVVMWGKGASRAGKSAFASLRTTTIDAKPKVLLPNFDGNRLQIIRAWMNEW
jgi:hypothetical protein